MTPADLTVTLAGRHVELVPLDRAHAAELAAAAAVDRDSYRYTTVPDGEAAMATYIETFVAQRDAGLTVPFAQRLTGSGRLVGCTRLMELRYWRDRVEPDEVEIGGTWLAGDVQRTPVNTESKLLLLTHAFEVWDVFRVALCSDARNARSRAAIERLGARFEGVLRNHRPSTHRGEEGQPRQSALFSITDREWPAIRRRLQARLDSRVEAAR